MQVHMYLGPTATLILLLALSYSLVAREISQQKKYTNMQLQITFNDIIDSTLIICVTWEYKRKNLI